MEHEDPTASMKEHDTGSHLKPNEFMSLPIYLNIMFVG
jgi:hypothetical protein